MRVGLVSDLHGNAIALEAVAADVEAAGVDTVVCLGDALQGGAEPARTFALLRELGWPVVLGNADAFLVDASTAEGDGEPITDRQLEVRAWSAEQLGPEHLAAVAAFPPTVELELAPGQTLLCCHAVPSSYTPILLPTTDEETFRSLLDGVDAAVAAGGHVHLQFVRRRGDLLWVNPGSAGLSYDHEQPEDDFRLDPWGAWAIVESDGVSLRVEFRRVPLDVEAIQAAIRASRMPYVEDHVRRWQPREAAQQQV